MSTSASGLPVVKRVIQGLPDPLRPYLHVPIITQLTVSGSYVGRVIVEQWVSPYGTAAQSSAGSADAVNGDAAGLLQQVAVTLPQAQLVASLPGPLLEFAGRPIISGFPDEPAPSFGMVGASYLGRVVAELWSNPAGNNAQVCVASVDAVDGDAAGLLEQVTVTFPERLAAPSMQGFGTPQFGQ
jgi:hypothetical protein